MKHTGSCHCGNIKFEVEGEIEGVISCNCSICLRKGALLWFVSNAQFSLLTPRDNLNTYMFNKHVIKHQFCPICGVEPFGEGTDPQGNAMVGINIRCLENINPLAVPAHAYDGKSL
jgi:hypothetical protein